MSNVYIYIHMYMLNICNIMYTYVYSRSCCESNTSTSRLFRSQLDTRLQQRGESCILSAHAISFKDLIQGCLFTCLACLRRPPNCCWFCPGQLLRRSRCCAHAILLELDLVCVSGHVLFSYLRGSHLPFQSNSHSAFLC